MLKVINKHKYANVIWFFHGKHQYYNFSVENCAYSNNLPSFYLEFTNLS